MFRHKRDVVIEALLLWAVILLMVALCWAVLYRVVAYALAAFRSTIGA